MAVEVTRVLDGSLENIESRKYNIFVPISLGNPYFNRENLRELVKWAIQFTKEKVIILVADDIQAINYEILAGLEKADAQKSAKKLGDNFVKMSQRVINSLSADEQEKITIARWTDIEHGKFVNLQHILKDEYLYNEEFQNEIHRVVRATLGEKIPHRDEALQRLGDYVIEEMPLMFKGITVNKMHYDAFPYPGLNELDMLVSDIQSRRKFSEIADKLGLATKQPIIEAYVKR